MFRYQMFATMVVLALLSIILFDSGAQRLSAQEIPNNTKFEPTAAYQWMEIMLEAAARDVERIGARPTILSRQMAITVTAMYDAWAAYDDTAVGTMLGGKLRRPAEQRTTENKEKAIAYAMYRACLDQFPDFKDYLTEEMTKMGYDPGDTTEDLTTPVGIGNHVAANPDRISTSRWSKSAGR